jgi:magnesium transporter
VRSGPGGTAEIPPPRSGSGPDEQTDATAADGTPEKLAAASAGATVLSSASGLGSPRGAAAADTRGARDAINPGAGGVVTAGQERPSWTVGGLPPQDGETFHGRDPDTVAGAAIAHSTPTRCQARTRLYRDGALELEGFPVDDISEYLADESAVIWLDLRDPDREDLSVLSAEFGLHPVAVEDAVHEHERPKLDRYRSHLFLLAYAVQLNQKSGELLTSELAAFVTPRALITVRKDDGLDIEAVVDYWDASPDLAGSGVGYLLYGLLDSVVDSHFAAVQALDGAIEDLEDRLFSGPDQDNEVQRRSFELRKSLVLLRRVVLPMREVVNSLMRRDLHVVSEPLHPYYQDVYDHVLRATEWTESLRDLVTTILETNLTMQGNRMNIITKQVTSWAAIVAVPTFVTGFYGMNVPYPGFGKFSGVLIAAGIMVGLAAVLYIVFKRRDWL